MNLSKLVVVAALALAGSARAQLPSAAAVDQAKAKVDARAEGAEAQANDHTGHAAAAAQGATVKGAETMDKADAKATAVGGEPAAAAMAAPKAKAAAGKAKGDAAVKGTKAKADTAAAFRDGWFLTGDMARRDSDGYVTILGRKSVDFIKSGGYKISAREIEDVLRRHPAVREVHDLHVWTITSGLPALSCHAVADVSSPSDHDRLLEELASLLRAQFGIGHATIQLESLQFTAEGNGCLDCE